MFLLTIDTILFLIKAIIYAVAQLCITTVHHHVPPTQETADIYETLTIAQNLYVTDEENMVCSPQITAGNQSPLPRVSTSYVQ